MGWLFGWPTRKDLVKHLTESNDDVETIKSCSVGNNLWCVHRYGDITYACLYLIKGPAFGNENDKYRWGYKDIDESMGPSKNDFPASWLKLLSPTTYEYAIAWRERVKARGEKIKRMKIGSKWGTAPYEIIERRSPTAFRIKDQRGNIYRAGLKWLLTLEEVVDGI
ncbi:MAG: hypothetical protein HC880_05125 [Bacteroidia bacterium]|nr:hypothetical protein [Bacteroidia bacterium]